jgi:hypothetical protein
MSAGARKPKLWPAFVVGIVTLGASAMALGTLLSAMQIHLKKLPIQARDNIKLHTLPTSFPRSTPRWEQARPDEIVSAEAAAELGTDNYLTRWYRRVGDPPDKQTLVQLHCAYYTGMIDTVPHVPERCFVGGGLEFASESVTVPVPLDMSRLIPDPDAPLDEQGRPVWMGRSEETHSRVRLPRGIEELKMKSTAFRDQSAKASVIAGYFFVANGGVVASADDVRLMAFRLTDDYAYYAKIQFMSTTAQSPEELAALAADLLNDLFPELMRRLPDWVAVQEGLYPPDNPRRQGRQNSSESPSPAGTP